MNLILYDLKMTIFEIRIIYFRIPKQFYNIYNVQLSKNKCILNIKPS